MDAETQRRVEETVLDILRTADMEKTTEYKIRNAASDRLGIDLSVPDRKQFVRQVVESFLLSKSQECADKEDDEEKEEEPHQKQQEEEEVEELQQKQQEEEEVEKPQQKQQEVEIEMVNQEKPGGRKQREYSDNGDLIVCHLSNKRRASITEFRGMTLLSIREFYEKDGKQLPSAKGISLTVDQWKAFKSAVPDIQAAVQKLRRGGSGL